MTGGREIMDDGYVYGLKTTKDPLTKKYPASSIEYRVFPIFLDPSSFF
jgi:hypothetical protein